VTGGVRKSSVLVRIAPARRSISRYAPYPPNDDRTTVHATAHQNA